MTNYLIAKLRGAGKYLRFLFFAVVMITILLLPQPALAQTKVTEMSLWLHGSQNNYNNQVKAGQNNKLFLDVRNNGTEPITNIKLSVETPEGWTIEISPAEIATLGAGSLHTVDVNIRPLGKAIKDGQEVTFTAQSTEIQNVKSSFFVTVKPAQSWIWFWIAAGVVVVAGFVIIYLKLGRQ